MEGRTCCGCIQLRIGCLIFACLSLIHRTVMFGFQVENMVRLDLHKIYLYEVIVMIYVLITLTYVVSTIILLIGLHMNKPTLVLIYLYASGITLVIDIVIANRIVIKYMGYYSLYQWCMAAIGFTVRCSYIYFYFVVRRYYKEITSESSVSNNNVEMVIKTDDV